MKFRVKWVDHSTHHRSGNGFWYDEYKTVFAFYQDILKRFNSYIVSIQVNKDGKLYGVRNPESALQAKELELYEIVPTPKKWDSFSLQ